MLQGEILKRFLTDKGITATQAAIKLGKPHRNYIYKYYQSEKFSSKILKQLKEVFGFEPTAYKKELRNTKVSDGLNEPINEYVIRTRGNVYPDSLEAAIASAYKYGEEIKDFTVEGDSMNPLLYDGQKIRTYKVDVDQIRDNYIYVVVYRDGRVANVKRVKNRLRERGEIILRSENEDYDKPIHIEKSDIQAVYQLYCSLNFNFASTGDLETRLTNIEIDIEQIKEHINF